jgi:hypothetical protein
MISVAIPAKPTATITSVQVLPVLGPLDILPARGAALG